MPRYRRQTEPDTVQHIISRFVNRQFLLDLEGARDEYLQRAERAFERSDWQPLGFALMSSHVHWVVRAGYRPSASFIKPLHCGFAAWINHGQRRLGPAFADRHRTIRCEGASAAALLAYIHNNPVRAGLVPEAVESRWTSHRMYAGLDPAPSWLDVTHGLELCGFSAGLDGRRAFDSFVRSRAAEPRCAVLSGLTMEHLRRRARELARGPVEIATPVARDGREVRVLEAPVVRPVDAPIRITQTSPLAVLRAVALSQNLTVESLRSRNRARTIVMGRRLALLVWTRHADGSAAHMANALGIATSSASELLANATASHQSLARELAATLPTAGPLSREPDPLRQAKPARTEADSHPAPSSLALAFP